jgi:antitoxin component YwqK of YwqJK toxin-antitoxin module
LQKYYYHNGNVKSEINYYADQLDGVNKFYSEDGKLEHIEIEVLGDAYGSWVYYNPDGSVKLTKQYYDDRQLSETKPAPVADPADSKGKPKPKPKNK